MNRTSLAFLIALLVVPIATPASAGKTVIRRGPHRTTVVHRGPHRTTVVVHRHFPIRRPLPVVVVRPPRVAVRIAPAVYLPPIVWVGTVVAPPAPSLLVWEDGETLDRDDEWVDFTLSVNDRGRKLYLDVVAGRVQLSFAEVVFENGDTRVVDFNDATRGRGLYGLLDFADGRMVDHVRVVAQAKTESAQLVVRMAK